MERLPPNWRALSDDPQKPVRKLTISNVDMSYKTLEALAQKCTFLKTITLDNVTCNGSKFFDASALQVFFAGRQVEIEVKGAPCTHENPWLQELLDYSDALGLTKEQMWNLYIALHNEEHANHPESAHGEERYARIEEASDRIRESFAAIAQVVPGENQTQ